MLVVERLSRPGMPEVSFRLEDGQCLSVMGASGSGKTLFLRALADLDPCEGSVTLDERERGATPAPLWRQRVCYVPAEPGWWADTPSQHFGNWPAMATFAEELRLPEDIGDAPVARLSTGERQRLALIRALELAPRVLLLDEPTGPLDDRTTEAVETVLHRHLADGNALTLVTHDSDQAARLSDRMLEFGDAEVTETRP